MNSVSRLTGCGVLSRGLLSGHWSAERGVRDFSEKWVAAVAPPLTQDTILDTAEQVLRRFGPAKTTVVDVARALADWVRLLAATKQGIAREDPELFATFRAVSAAAGQVIDTHVAHLAAQLATIVRDGVATGVLVAAGPEATGLAVLQATALFHHPAHADEWADPRIGQHLESVLELVLSGLRPR